MKRVVAVALWLAALSAARVFAAGTAVGDAGAGAKIVADHGCMSCHGAKFEGGIGPKLYGIEHRKSAAEITMAIKQPGAPMPDFKFTARQLADVVAYLSGLDGGVKR